jgi:hypothetical protein
LASSLSPSTQILSFDNFAALESHLKATREKYQQLTRRYEEVLGNTLREFKPTQTKGKNQEQWALNIRQALNSKDSKGKYKPPKEKNQKDGTSGEEWVSLDPISIFVGRTNRGISELYFEAINQLRSDLTKIDAAISLTGKLKSRSSSANNAALIVSVINDIPTKIVVKPANEGVKKFSLSCEITVPRA